MSRFQIINNEIVLDKETGLQWTKNYVIEKTWDQAQEYCNELNAQRYGGFSDWRVPTIAELITLIDFERRGPASSFPDMPSKTFWSSSSYANITANAWYVSFAHGNVNNAHKTNVFAARCARGGPLVLGSQDKKKRKKEVPLSFSQLRLRRF